MVKNEAWITEAAKLITHNELKPGGVVTWAGFNSTLQSDDNVKPRANIGILPLFPDKAATVAMVKHSLLLGMSLTDYLNPGQIPVQGMDQPIYAIGRQIQWKWKEDLGEDKYVLMLGALHIEFVIEAVEGKLTDGSRFSYIISEAGVLTSGRSEAISSLAPDHHLKRTRYVHQMFLLAGSILKLEAFEAHQASAGPCQKENWDAAMRMSSKQFAFWSLVMHVEMLQCALFAL